MKYTHEDIIIDPDFEPFDLSDKDVRDYLRGKWIVLMDNDKGAHLEVCISEFAYMPVDDDEEEFKWLIATVFGGILAEDLLEKFTFLDGTPCGELVTEEDCNED